MGAQYQILDAGTSVTGYNQDDLIKAFAAHRGYNTFRILSTEEVRELVK